MIWSFVVLLGCFDDRMQFAKQVRKADLVIEEMECKVRTVADLEVKGIYGVVQSGNLGKILNAK